MQLHRINTGRRGPRVGTIRGFIELQQQYYDGGWKYSHELIEGEVLAKLEGKNDITYAISNGAQVMYVRETPDGWYALNADQSKRFAAIANARRAQLAAAA